MATYLISEFPAFTSKGAILRALHEAMEPNVPNFMELLYRIDNTDLTGITDAANNLGDANTWPDS